MSTPNNHAVVGPSSFERWSHCTAAPRYEENFPNESTVYTREGTLAHSVCELHGKKRFGKISTRKYNTELKKLQANELWQDEMLKTADFYTDFLAEKANMFKTQPYTVFEVCVDLSDWIPEGFGTCDNVMLGDDLLRITDYKHGRGVAVSSINNGQMRLYALGALKLYRAVYGSSIKRVCTAIVQPRITEDVTEEWLTVDELLAWGEEIKPKATAAFFGAGTFVPGEWCGFCKGRAQCRERAKYFAAFEPVMRETATRLKDAAGVEPALSDAEVGDLLERAAGLSAWYSDLKDYALQACLAGRTIPGYKIVEGRRERYFTDADSALEKLRGAGYPDAVLFDRKQKTLAQLEKLMAKKDFSDLMGPLIAWKAGSPTLVTESDKREAFVPNGPGEFAGVGAGG